jgi:hypothetical protein
LLLVNIPWLDDPADPDRVAFARVVLNRIDAQVVRKLSKMAGVLAVNRVWTGMRHQYRGALLEGECGVGLAKRVEEGLNHLEGTGDILQLW